VRPAIEFAAPIALKNAALAKGFNEFLRHGAALVGLQAQELFMSLKVSVHNVQRWFSRVSTRAVQHLVCLSAVGLVSSAVLAQPHGPQKSASLGAKSGQHSDTDAQLFFQLLVGEMQWREGQRSAAFELMLDAARRAKSEQLFLRATEMALQAKSGDQALSATQSWRAALPQSVGAHNYMAQLFVALNRPQEAVEPLRALIGLAAPAQRSAFILSVQGFFARLPDRKVAASLVEEALEPSAKAQPTRMASLVASSRAWFAAQDKTRAWALLQDAHALEPAAVEPAILAAEMLRDVPAAETVVTHVLQAQPKNTELRLYFSRSLMASQRYADAIVQLESVTQINPEVSGPWLTLGALHVEVRHPQEARKALNTYLQRLDEQDSAARAGEEKPDDEAQAPPDKGRTEAWMQLAEAAEQEADYAAAAVWLDKVTDPQRATQVQLRRASLLVKQGKSDEALSLVASLPDTGEEASRTKLFAQSQVLREAKRWREAFALLQTANERFPNDTAVLYERAMVAEKLGAFEDMEALLRQVMTLKPEHALAHNALGYSLADRNLRLDEAKALIQRALELAPGDPLITDSLGWVEFRLGQHEEALRWLRWAFRARPDAEIGAHLGEVLWVQGKQEEALGVWRQAHERDAGNEVLRDTLKRLKARL
jgi:tetratricopeptide (TPR) repeat protein